jgi:hypothetical protein
VERNEIITNSCGQLYADLSRLGKVAVTVACQGSTFPTRSIAKLIVGELGSEYWFEYSIGV